MLTRLSRADATDEYYSNEAVRIVKRQSHLHRLVQDRKAWIASRGPGNHNVVYQDTNNLSHEDHGFENMVQSNDAEILTALHEVSEWRQESDDLMSELFYIDGCFEWLAIMKSEYAEAA